MRVDCVIFDMDGLIIDSERLSFKTMLEEIRSRGFDLTKESYVELLGTNIDYTAGYLESLYPGTDGMELIAAWTRRYVEAVERGEQRIKPGFIELDDELKKRGIKSAVASSNLKKMVMLNLNKLGLTERFDVIVYDGMAERAKPFPDLFLKASGLTETEPKHCLVLEDSFAGIKAAHAAEMRAIMIPDMREPTPDIRALCERVCDSLTGVIGYLDETNKA